MYSLNRTCVYVNQFTPCNVVKPQREKGLPNMEEEIFKKREKTESTVKPAANCIAPDNFSRQNPPCTFINMPFIHAFNIATISGLVLLLNFEMLDKI